MALVSCCWVVVGEMVSCWVVVVVVVVVVSCCWVVVGEM